MENPLSPSDLDLRMAGRLRAIRSDRGWSLDQLAARTGVSRATLSRLENGEVSPTANVLGRLCAAFGITLSRLMHLVEGDFEPLVRGEAQPAWTDPETGFVRRSVSPPSQTLAGEAIEGTLRPGSHIAYDAPPRPGLEHHLVMLEGRLALTIGNARHELGPGDCLRYQLYGPSVFATPADAGARYLLFMV
jgi:transcriptional regulator with XRE-family HTH domain